MNIKEHIEAGHYPKDDKGRALVKMHGGDTAIILATDWRSGSDRHVILGWRDRDDTHPEILTWAADGKYFGNPLHAYALLPPSPRKVPLKFGLIYTEQGWMVEFVNCGDQPARGTRVQVTGEYEEPWS